MKHLAVLIAILILALPSSSKPEPEPVPPVPQKDVLDTSADNYRVLMADIWLEFSIKRSTFTSDVEALEWINTRQTAAFTAAFDPFIKLAAAAAKQGGDAKSFSEAIRNRTLK